MMTPEARLQNKIVKYLRSKGFWVMKTRPGMGTPVGAPDIIALYEGWWLAIEVKSSATAPFQPLQKKTLEKLSEWSHVWVAYPENWGSIRAEIDSLV